MEWDRTHGSLIGVEGGEGPSSEKATKGEGRGGQTDGQGTTVSQVHTCSDI